MRARGRAPVRVAVPELDEHPSSYVIRDFTNALVREGVEPIRLRRWVGSVLSRSGLRVQRSSGQLVIVPLMGRRSDVLAAASLYGRPVPFCWDVWEPEWELWANLLDTVQAPLVVTTSLQSAQHLQVTLTSALVRHLPEATAVGRYKPGGPLSHRTTDVLELGRRNPRWHEAVEAAARGHGLKHLYERRRGEFIFSDEASLIAGLADTKISVCFPSNITHPERSGSVSTLTNRYLESMASRCLVLGHAPDELSDLFGFNPVIEADTTEPWSQLESIVDSVESYQASVDEAYRAVQSLGSWRHRVRQLLGLIRAL
jgi:hypothetical protein